jgi:hypothetical protein
VACKYIPTFNDADDIDSTFSLLGDIVLQRPSSKHWALDFTNIRAPDDLSNPPVAVSPVHLRDFPNP